MKKLVQKNHYDYSAKLEAFPYQHEAFNEIKDKDLAKQRLPLTFCFIG